MVDRQTLRTVIDRCLLGEYNQAELTAWAYDLINRFEELDDHLVAEVVYNLVSLNNADLIFENSFPSKEKLQIYMKWLDDKNECNLMNLPPISAPTKLM